MSSGSMSHFFFDDRGKPVILEAKGRETERDGEWTERHVDIRFDDGDIELHISLPKEAAKKLAAAIQNFFQSGKTSCFYEDEFLVGDSVRNKKRIPAVEALKQYFT